MTFRIKLIQALSTHPDETKYEETFGVDTDSTSPEKSNHPIMKHSFADLCFIVQQSTNEQTAAGVPHASSWWCFRLRWKSESTLGLLTEFVEWSLHLDKGQPGSHVQKLLRVRCPWQIHCATFCFSCSVQWKHLLFSERESKGGGGRGGGGGGEKWTEITATGENGRSVQSGGGTEMYERWRDTGSEWKSQAERGRGNWIWINLATEATGEGYNVAGGTGVWVSTGCLYASGVAPSGFLRH